MTVSTAHSRLEVVYPERASFLTRRPNAVIKRANTEHLDYVGRIHYDGEVYADPEVIVEATTARRLGFRANALIYHATSSAALPAIARHGALLSSKELIAAQEPILTGEISSDEGWLHRHNNGLSDVYGSGSAIDTHYARAKGENHPVIFGLNPSGIDHKTSMDYGDGIELGARVSLGAVAAQIVPFDKVSETKEWSQAHCPQDAITMSLDAAFLLTYGLAQK